MDVPVVVPQLCAAVVNDGIVMESTYTAYIGVRTLRR